MEKFVPLTEKSLEPNADGDFQADDPSLDRVGNLIRYMRTHPAYVPPNPKPVAMIQFDMSSGGRLLSTRLDAFDDFASKADADLFEDIPEEVHLIIFLPSNTLELNFEKLLAEDLTHTLQYLINNRWCLYRSEITATKKPR